MSKWNNFFEKRKEAILIIVAIITILGVSAGIYKIIHNQPVIRIDENIVLDKKYTISEYIIVGDKNGIIKGMQVNDGAQINAIDIKKEETSTFIYSKSKDFKRLYAYEVGQNKFHEMYLNNGKVTSKELIDLKDKKINISDFNIDGDNIIAISGDKKGITKISLIDSSIKFIALKDTVENWIVTDGYVVYSSGTNINSVNIIDDKIKQIDLGDSTTGLFLSNGEIIEFNKFGSKKNTSIMLKINPADLYIKSMTKFDTSNISGIANYSEDRDIYIGEVASIKEENTQLISNINIDTMLKNTISFNSKREQSIFKYDKNNSISAKGYVYSLVDNTIEITDTKVQQVVRKMNVDGTVFMPVVK